MINFEEELKRFQPIPEVNQAEEAIYNNDLKDISDIVIQMTNDIRVAAASQPTSAVVSRMRG